MRATATICIWIVRVAGTLQLLLGALFWTGHAYSFLPLHILSGVVIVLTLWTVAALALVARGRRGLAIFGLLWGLALPAFGMLQANVLAGPMHWIVRVLHLLMGLAAMAVAAMLGQAVLGAVPGTSGERALAGGGASTTMASHSGTFRGRATHDGGRHRSFRPGRRTSPSAGNTYRGQVIRMI